MSVRSRIVRWLQAWVRPRDLGERGERLAARYLRRRGYRIVESRARSRRAEIDLIAIYGRTIVFVEVKTRASREAGHPAEVIDRNKRQRMQRGALAWLKQRGLLDYAARFDVVAITWPEQGEPTIEHFPSAFEGNHDSLFS